MKNVKLGSGLKKIGSYVFHSSGLESIVIPDNITEIGVGAFNACEYLKNVTIGSGVEKIGNYAFCRCNNMKSVTIPATVTSIGRNAFGYIDTSDGTTVEGFTIYCIPDSAASAYARENGFRSIESDTIADTALAYTIDGGVLTVYKYKDEGSTFIPESQFDSDYHTYYSDAVKKVVIQDGVTGIDRYAFYALENLEEVVIGDTLEYVGYEAFLNCPNLSALTIGTGLEAIDYAAFENCPNLKEVYIYSKDIEYVYDYALGYIYNSEKNQDYPIKDFVIHGYSGTGLEEYADLCGFDFVSICDHEDTSGNGACNKCGELMDGMAKIRACSLNLDGSIDVNFKMQFSDKLTAEELSEIYVRFTLPNGRTSKVYYSDAEDVTVSGAACKKFTFPVYSMEMAETITATVCKGSAEGTSYNYSVKKYLDSKASTTNTTLKSLITAMRNYGAASQTYFSYNTSDLVAPLGTLADPPSLAAYKNVRTVHDNTKGLNFSSGTLLLESETVIKIKCTVESGHSMSEYKFTVKDSEGKNVPFTVSAAEKAILIPNIKSVDLDQMFTVTAYKGSTKLVTLKYGAFSYIYSKLSSTSSSTEIKNIARALYAYNKASKAHLS